jgi:cytochrome P450
MSRPATTWTNPPADEPGLLDWLRRNREYDPVQRAPNGDWHVFGYPEASACLTNHADFSNELPDVRSSSSMRLFAVGNLTWMDPPRHRELRSAVGSLFSARASEAQRPMVDRIFREQMDAIRGQESVKFIDGFAFPAMLRTIAEMIGLPESGYLLFGRWIKAIWLMTTSGDSPNVLRLLAALTAEMDRTLHELIAERKREPRDDLVSTLVGLADDGRVFSDEEVAGLVALIVVSIEGGAPQTLANAIVCLDRFPGVRERLAADPGALGPAIEEVIRFRSQTVRVSRRTVRPAELGRHVIPAGSQVSIWLMSANRDARVFDRPDDFDIDRRDNPHLALGKGVHFCLGAPLGRLQVRLGLERLLGEWAGFAVDEAGSSPLEPRIFGGFRELVVRPVWRVANGPGAASLRKTGEG